MNPVGHLWRPAQLLVPGLAALASLSGCSEQTPVFAFAGPEIQTVRRGDLRITIDRNIRCRKLNLSLREQRTRGVWVIPPTFLILEVKFNETVPRWLCHCLNTMDLVGDRFSKYSTGVERMDMQNRLMVQKGVRHRCAKHPTNLRSVPGRSGNGA